MASIAALYIDSGPVALCSCVGSASPRVLLNGVLRGQVNIAALAAERSVSEQQAEEQLLTTLSDKDLDTELAHVQEKNGSRQIAAVCVSALHDAIVIPSEGQLLYNAVSRASSVSEFVGVVGGHASAIVFSKRNFVPEIIKSFALLENLKRQQDEK